jgi:hypothetical protein
VIGKNLSKTETVKIDLVSSASVRLFDLHYYSYLQGIIFVAPWLFENQVPPENSEPLESL